MSPWVKRTALGAAVIVIALQWVNTRVSMLRTNQNPADPITPTTYAAFHSMAIGLSHGRIGQVDLEALHRYLLKDHPAAEIDRDPGGAAERWANYYTLDVGYSFIVAAARLAFPSLPDNHLRALALQLFADAALVWFVGFVFAQWNLWLGVLAAYLYVSNAVFQYLVSFPFYYYWDVPIAFFVLGSLLMALHRPVDGTRWLVLAALALGFGIWLRGSWWPLSLFFAALAAASPTLRRRLAIPLVVFALVAVPQVVRSSVARGHLAFSTRAVWHVALVGLGYYPNPYGLAVKDTVIFKLTEDKYGVPHRTEDYEEHDLAAKKEFLSIWRNDPRFVIRSFWGRLRESIAGSTESSLQSFPFVRNVLYRLICGAACVLMIVLGGTRRLVALAAAGCYAVYVLLTSAFFYVGTAYDNVSQVTLFFLFVMGIEAAVYTMGRGLGCDEDVLTGS